MEQLKCGNLKSGDILLKIADGSIIGGLIQFGQAQVGGLNARVVHAGVMFDHYIIIESQGGGLAAHDLRVQNKAYGYLVFRHANPQIAAGAGTCAKMMFDIHKSGGNLGYTVLGALGSLFGGSGTAASRTEMDALLDRILAGKTHRFFCSQFVVYVYQFVGEQCGQPASSFFNFADAKVPPSTLAQALNGNGKFNEVGYMIGGER